MAGEDKIQEILINQTRMEGKIDRLVSDAESEKEVRKRRNDEVDKRLHRLELWQAKWAGALALLCLLAVIFSIVAFFKK